MLVTAAVDVFPMIPDHDGVQLSTDLEVYMPVATSLLTSCSNLSQQAHIRMRSYGLRQLVDDKPVASGQQACCKLILKTFYLQACYMLFQQVATSLQMTSCNKPNFNKLVAS